MSLPPPPLQRSLFDVSNMLSGSFDPDDRFRLFAEKVYPLLLAARRELEACYCPDNGRPGEEPVLLLGATLLQFMERLADRQAAECVKYHTGWKLALMLGLAPTTFHPTTLCNFRQRLLEHDKAKLAFDIVLQGALRAGLVKQRQSQRLDSTHVLGQVAEMSRLECVREAIRLALRELQHAGSSMTQPLGLTMPAWWPRLWERYVESKLDYRADRTALIDKMNQAGLDAWELLCWTQTLSSEAQAAEIRSLAQGEKVLLLARVFGENFEPPTATEPPKQMPAQVSAAVKNPHDPDAQYSRKKGRSATSQKRDSAGDGPDATAPRGGTEWVGYKVQVAETVVDEPREKGEPTLSLITSVETPYATASDEAGMKQTLEAQAESNLSPPDKLFVDAAYVSAGAIGEAESQGRELIGPAQRATNKAHGFKTEAFDVNVENRTAVCPAGHASANCSRLENKTTGAVSFRFEWGGKNGFCANCPLRAQCLSPGQDHRTLNVGQSHTLLQTRRRQMQTMEFKQTMKRRNAIEGTQSELIRGHGLRRARYRGLPRARLQNYFIGAAANVKRWSRRVAWEFKEAARREAERVKGILRPEITAETAG